MGDRCYVELMIQTNDEDEVINRIDYDFTSDGPDNCTNFVFYETGYGDIGCEEALQKAGIPYDRYWGRGAEYDSGTEYCRYTKDGEIEIKTAYESEDTLSLDQLEEMLENFKTNPEMGYKIINKRVKDKRESITPLPWEGQDINKKTYRTKQLITQSA